MGPPPGLPMPCGGSCGNHGGLLLGARDDGIALHCCTARYLITEKQTQSACLAPVACDLVSWSWFQRAAKQILQPCLAPSLRRLQRTLSWCYVSMTCQPWWHSCR
jgi:hypothetical protein